MTHLVLDSDEAEHLAVTLADRTGETVVEAVTVAMRERLERVERERIVAVRLAAIADIQARVAAKIAASGIPFPTMAEIDAELYDANGLPH